MRGENMSSSGAAGMRGGATVAVQNNNGLVVLTASNNVAPTTEKMFLERCEFESVYTKGDFINAGTYGKVYKCRRTAGAQLRNAEATEYAVKIQDVSYTNDNPSSTYAKTMNEAKTWRSLAHKNIVKLYECFLERNQFYFVMELVQGDNLFDEILKKMSYSEKDACGYIQQILDALSYLHSKHIIHRDIKPDNIMLCNNGNQGPSLVKLIDFGLARRLPNGKERMECAPSGAPLYLAPETIMGLALGCPVDVWSCGVILYIMLYGAPPFWSEDTDKLFLDIVGAEVDYSCTEQENVSFLAKDLIQEMLVKDQRSRITASEAQEHPWVVQASKLSREHRRSTLEQLSVFRKCSCALEAQYKARKSLRRNSSVSI